MDCCHARTPKCGFTLIELLVAVAIIAVVACIAAVRTGRVVQRSRAVAAEADLSAIRDAFVSSDGGYLRDMAGLGGFAPSELRIANLLVPTNIFGIAGGDGVYYPRGERLDDVWLGGSVAKPLEFATWDGERERGWRGPYVRGVSCGVFPVRSEGESRGFYPDLSGLYLADFFTTHDEVSIYGMPGEPAILDPWGNPYVLQVPPPQAFTNVGMRAISPEERFAYARIVSAGEDGRIDAPCFFVNPTNDSNASVWDERLRRLSRQAGLIDGDDRYLRGDDIVLFLFRNDIDEGGTE